jgi:hypothetical protein
MPLTEQERRFLGHYSGETRHFELGHDSCVRQLRERGIDHHDLLPLLKLEEEEPLAEGGEPLSLENIRIPKIPGKEPKAPKGWVYRGRFPGIKRGHVEEALRKFPVSVWDPTYQSSLASQCEYLLLVETKAKPLRIWGITRSDILWFTANEGVYKTIFPTPPLP